MKIKSENLKKIIYYSFFVLIIIYFAFFSLIRKDLRSGDFSNYKKFFNKILNSKFGPEFEYSFSFEPVFYNFFFSIYDYGFNISTTISIISILIFTTFIYLSNFLVSDKFKYSIVFLFTISISFVTLFISQSIIRQGLGCIFFSLFILFRKNKISLLYYLLSIITHNIYLIYIFTFFTRSIFYFSILIIIMFLASIYYVQILEFFGRFRMGVYFERGHRQVGVRYDFILFSFIPFAYFYIKLFLSNITNNNFKISLLDQESLNFYFKIFIVLTSISFIFRDFPDHDRFFIILWVYIPIIMTFVTSRIEYLIFSSLFITLSIYYQPQRYIFF